MPIGRRLLDMNYKDIIELVNISDRCSFENNILTRLQFPVTVSLNIQLDGWHLKIKVQNYCSCPSIITLNSFLQMNTAVYIDTLSYNYDTTIYFF